MVSYLDITKNGRLETCLSLSRDLLADFASFDGPDVDSVEDPGPQISQKVSGGVRPQWDLPTRALRRAVGEDVAVYFGLGWIP